MAPRAPDGGARNLWTRIASAAVLAPMALAATWAGGVWFDLMVLAAAGLLAWEWARVCGYGRFGGIFDWLFVALVVSVVMLQVLGAPDPAPMAAAVVLALAWLAIGGLTRTEAAGWRTVGLLLVALACVSLLSLRHQGTVGFHAVLWVLFVTWAVDTGGYVVGRLAGGPKLAPRISPKKTWSGAIGGLAAAIAVGAASAYGVATLTLAASVAGALVVGGAAIIGDLLESAAKRRFGLKDSSSLIPGHGGLLDRVDGLLLAAPVALLIFSESWRWS